MKNHLSLIAVTLFALPLTLLTGCSEQPEETVVKIAVDVPYEPFEFKAPDGSLTGFEIDLGNAACAELAIKCEWVVQGWDGIIPGLLAFKYDAIMSSMSITAERAEKVAFTKGYYNTPSGWFVSKGTDLNVMDKDAMAGKKIGVQRGTVQDDAATSDYPDSEILRYATADELVLDLYGGRLDAVLLDYPVGESTILKGERGEQFELTGELLQLGDGVGMAMRKDDLALVSQFNTALDAIKSDGRYDEIRKKYFDYDIKM